MAAEMVASEGTTVGKEGLPVRAFTMPLAYVMRPWMRVGSLRTTIERSSVLVTVMECSFLLVECVDGLDAVTIRGSLGVLRVDELSFLVRERTSVVVGRNAMSAERTALVVER